MNEPAPVLRPLGTGELLDAGFTLYRRHFARLITVMALATGPAIAVSAFHPWLGTIASLLGQFAAQIGVIWIVAEVFLGARPRDQGVPGVILRSIVPVLGLQVVVILLIVLGMLALVVPGVLLTIMLFCVVQVAVIEGDVGAAFPRSWHLAQGSMGRVALVILFVGLLNLVIGGTLQLGMHDWDVKQLADASFLDQPSLGEFALSLVVSMVVAPYGTIVMTLLYFDQRVRKDGFDVEFAAQAAGP